MTTRRKLSLILKSLIALVSLLGTTLALIFAERDGYSHWAKRLLYFTQQSNLWIGTLCLVLLIFLLLDRGKHPRMKKLLYLLKFVFTVSITLTGIVFCAFLAPFLKDSAWTFSGVLTHIAVPVLSITDFFIDPNQTVHKPLDVPLSALPPVLYFVFSYLLGQAGVDFGKGDPYPYPFLNFHSEAGLWGYMDGSPPLIGTGYWIIAIFLLILGIAFLYAILHPSKKHKNQ